MPIPGLKSRPESYPKIGDIRKGAKKTSPKKPGPDLDYFRYAVIEGEEEAAAAFHAVYGDQPREIEILLPFDQIDRVFDAFMERYTSNALQCRGDIEGGWHFLRRRDDGEMESGRWECPMPICEGCKETGRIKAIIPALRRLAYVEFHTTSIWDIQEIYGNLRGLMVTEGRITGIPCVVKRRPRNISRPVGGGKRIRKESWLLSIEAAPRFVDAQLAEMEGAIALRAGNGTALIEPGEIIDGEVVEGDTLVETAEELGGEVIDALKEAADYVTSKGARLGDLGLDELGAMVEWVDAQQKPGPKARTLKRHCLVLIEAQE